ncbi:MAG: hypothetical protein IPG10_13600 [Flavobacteriales bacterium]|nr:hypothetical protein [Flavobacteriales bacterium]
MKLRLDDNTRSALHFLLLAVGVLGALRLAYVAFLSGTRAVGPDAAALEPWRHGYLLHDPYAVVRASTTLPERLAWVFLYAILGGFAVYLLVSFFARSLRHADARYPVIAGRIAGSMVLLLATVGALWWPPQEVWPDRAAREWKGFQRGSLPGDLTLPWTGQALALPFGELVEIDMERAPEGEVALIAAGPFGTFVLAAQAESADPMLDEAAAQRAIGALSARVANEP